LFLVQDKLSLALFDAEELVDARMHIVADFFPRPDGRKLRDFLSARHQEHNTAGKNQRTRDGCQRQVVCLFASRVNRSDIENLLSSRVGETSPHKSEQTNHNQDNPKRFVHGCLPRQ
jgi:hypothetical protein